MNCVALGHVRASARRTLPTCTSTAGSPARCAPRALPRPKSNGLRAEFVPNPMCAHVMMTSWVHTWALADDREKNPPTRTSFARSPAKRGPLEYTHLQAVINCYNYIGNYRVPKRIPVYSAQVAGTDPRPINWGQRNLLLSLPPGPCEPM
jgi:hypothetical protein